MMKRVLSLFLAIVMVLGMLPVSAFASETEAEHEHIHETVAETSEAAEETESPAEETETFEEIVSGEELMAAAPAAASGFPISVKIDGVEKSLTSLGKLRCFSDSEDLPSYSITVPSGAQELYIACSVGSMNIHADYNIHADICGGNTSCTVDLTQGYQMLCINNTGGTNCHLYLLTEGATPLAYPFELTAGSKTLKLNQGSDEFCDMLWGDVATLTTSTSSSELVLKFFGQAQKTAYVYLYNKDTDWDGYDEYVDDLYPEDDGSYVISLPMEADYLCIETEFFDYHYFHLYIEQTEGGPKFTATVNGETIYPEDAGMIGGKPSYLLTVPAGTTAVDFTFSGEKDYHFYNDQGVFLGTGESNSSATYTIPVQDAFRIGASGLGEPGSDGVLDGIAVQKAGTWSAEYYIMFAYAASGEEHEHKYEGVVTTQPGCESEGVKTFTCSCGDSYTEKIAAIGHSYVDGTCANCGGKDPDYNPAPFLSIKIGGVEIAIQNIEYKGIFKLGDYAEDEQQGVEDYYDYVHEVPYYHVTVPCGTGYVDVTYSKETNIMNYSGTAYGYRTDLEVDAMSSATVRSATFKDAYTKNEDGTQTVKTPVTGYTFDEDGNGHAITLEADGGSYEAVCLFTFEYDGKNHVYDSGVVTTQPGCESEGVKTFTCSCGHSYTEAVNPTGHDYQEGICANCGGEDPDYAAPGGAEIPADAPFTAVTTDVGSALAFEDRGPVDYNGWSVYEGIPYYHVTIPAGSTEVYVTHPASTDPFADVSYGSAYGYVAETEGWTGSGANFAFVEAEDGYTITLPLSIMVDTDGDWSVDTEGSFVADADGYVGYAVAVENNDYAPICFFTFEFAAGEPGAHEHNYTEEVTTEPGCETKGVKTFTCGCGDSYTQEIPAIGHKYDSGVQTKAPTCNDAGETLFTCQNDSSHTKTQTIAKLGHKYGEAVVTTKPTCTEKGEKTYTCSQCAEGTDGHTKTEAVAATGHDYQNGSCVNCGDVCPQQDENGVFQIGTYEELLWFAREVNSGNTAIKGALTADITLPEDWPGIGNSSNKFAGEFDGQNHTVTLSGSTWGLFAYAMGTWNSSNYNIVTPVIIENVITAGTTKSAPLAQRAGYARIRNCVNKADVVGGSSYIGGIVGNMLYALQYNSIKYNDLIIENCINEGDIAGVSCVGGILGEGLAGVKIQGCVNTGTISGSDSVGGLAGFLQEGRGTVEINNSYNTGKVTGSAAGGIIGKLYNSVSLINCYNAGEATYAIAGYVYNNTSPVTNTYYRSDLSDYDAPETIGYGGYNTVAHGIGKSSAEMGTAAFAALLGDAFKESCGGPVLTWQTAKEHNLVDGICYDCKAYHEHETVKAKFLVHKGTGGYEIVGDTEVTAGNSYSFTVNILDGYYAENLTVYFNGTVVTADAEGKYTVTPTGHFYITVTGVKELQGVVPVVLPGAGNGYRVVPCEGYSTTVESGKEFKFTVSFVNGFTAGKNFAVKANGVELTPNAEDVYTIENVIIKQTITVEGVDILPVDPITVKIAVTKGETDFYVMEETGAIMMEQEMEVPYFDIALYGLDHIYYNPYCYLDEQGNIRTQQKAGNKETAYGVVTTLHALIYATELYYFGYDEDIIGTGYSNTLDQDGDGVSDFKEALNVTANAGSTFTYMWGDGGNLNYHLNYTYPLAYPEWGSTSDQQPLKDGDVISIHFITGSASGSAFGFFAVNDANNVYNKTEQLDHATVTQGETVKLTHYVASQGDNYNSRFDPVGNKDLYWVEQGNESYHVEAEDEEAGTTGDWYRDGFGGLTADAFKTDANGEIVIDTTNIEPGTYYIAAQGGFTAGNGQAGSDGFVSRGAEAGPAYFTLTVEEGGNESQGHSFCAVDDKIICTHCGEELSVSIPQEYVALKVGQTLKLAVSPAEFAEKIQWTVDGEEEGIITMEGSVITAQKAGTVYVTATVGQDGFESVARFRVDVVDKIEIDGVQLVSKKATAELYKNEFATFEILLQLRQNNVFAEENTASQAAAMAQDGNGIAIDSAKFTDGTMADYFDLVVLDDRTVQVVPTQKALDNAKSVKGSYKGTVTVTVAGNEYKTETMTLTVKKTQPKLKASVAAFNSFYSGQSQTIVITGGTVTEVRENAAKNTAKATAIPTWLTLDAEGKGILTLNDAPAKNVSGKAYIEVWTGEWRIPAQMTLSVKNTYKVPVLKLSATSTTLNTLSGDEKTVTVTSSFADYDLSGLKVTHNAGEALTVEQQENGFTVSTNENTLAGKNYKITVKDPTNAKIKAVTLTVKTVGKNPSMNKLKVKGTMDVTFPVNKTTVSVSLKDYADAFEPELVIKDSTGNIVTERFSVSDWNGTAFEIMPNGAAKGTYTAIVSVAIEMGETVEDVQLTKSAKLTVKQTLPKVKLSAAKVTLNKKLDHSAVIDVFSATKGYELEHDRVDVVEPEQVDAAYENGKLIVTLKEGAAYGKTYKITVRAYAGAPAVTLSVAVPEEAKSNIGVSIKAAGTIDVIREGTAITVTPSFTNAFASDIDSVSLNFYKKNGKVWEKIEENIPFNVADMNGKCVITAAEGLLHTDKYQVELVAKMLDGKEISSKKINLTVKMGSTKLTLKSSNTTLFAKDKHDRALVWFEAKDVALNEVSGVEIKSAKQAEQFKIIEYGSGVYAIAFKDGNVDKSLVGKSVTVTLNVFIEGNMTAKANTTAKVKLTIVK